MGMFSWICSDTKKPLICFDINTEYNHKNREYCTKKAFCLIPKEFGGGSYKIDHNYDGYGDFYDDNGKEVDVYAALGRWNAPDKCIGVDTADRQVGIDIQYNSLPGYELKYPLKIVENETEYDLANPSETDPGQGWGFADD